MKWERRRWLYVSAILGSVLLAFCAGMLVMVAPGWWRFMHAGTWVVIAVLLGAWAVRHERAAVMWDSASQIMDAVLGAQRQAASPRVTRRDPPS